ncbi:MAG: peptidoglycan DD-metalloendopeptidase family protein [Gammaproteobacteria bacterium]
MGWLRCLLLGCVWLPALLLAAPRPPSKDELTQIEQTIGKVQKEITSLNHQRTSVSTEVQNNERDINQLQGSLDKLAAEINTERLKLAQFKTESAALLQQRKAQQELLAGYLRSAWINGKQEYLKLLLNQQNPADTARISRYYQYFSAARTRTISSYTQLLAGISTTETAITAATEALAQRQNELLAQRSNLADKQGKRQTLLANLDADLNERGKKLNALEQERVEKQLLMEELSKRSLANLSKTEPFAGRKGHLPWPVDGKLLHSFGSRYELGDLTYEGIDLAASAGTDIKAIHHGRVVFADWFGNSGLLLIIDHGDGYMSLYAHNAQLNQKLGAWVQRGDVIASVGNTGGQHQSGLYFEIRHEGKAENPALWCMPRK